VIQAVPNFNDDQVIPIGLTVVNERWCDYKKLML
jgi:hypothetical protein